jgi:hypothetical protein
MVQMIRNDAEFRKTVISLLRLDPWRRKSIITEIVENMKSARESSSLVTAMASLLDDEVVASILQMLKP